MKSVDYYSNPQARKALVKRALQKGLVKTLSSIGEEYPAEWQRNSQTGEIEFIGGDSKGHLY